MQTKIIHPLQPVYDCNSRFLILGTMPSPVSREQGFYYMHPQNRFWPVLAAVFGEPLPQSIEDKRAFLMRRRIALWDVLASCEINGAADSSIKNPLCNDFSAVLAATKIAKEGAIFTTGAKAHALYTRFCETKTGIAAQCLPSPSAANAQYSLKKLTEHYKVLLGEGTGQSN